MSGGELFEHILDHGPLKETSAKSVMQSVFSAVSYLHDRGIIHRDIKAENLLVSQIKGGLYSIKLIDFGFSKVLRYNLAGSFLGTGGYIAPEIRHVIQYTIFKILK